MHVCVCVHVHACLVCVFSVCVCVCVEVLLQQVEKSSVLSKTHHWSIAYSFFLTCKSDCIYDESIDTSRRQSLKSTDTMNLFSLPLNNLYFHQKEDVKKLLGNFPIFFKKKLVTGGFVSFFCRGCHAHSCFFFWCS